MCQSGEVCEGPFFNNSQTFDILHSTVGNRNERKASVITILLSVAVNKQTRQSLVARQAALGTQGLIRLLKLKRKAQVIQRTAGFNGAAWILGGAVEGEAFLTFQSGCAARGRRASVSL